jgi:hypothetical protein
MPMMGHLPKGKRFQIQYDRVIRWYERLNQLYTGKFHNQSFAMDCDEMLIFFIFCHQLKDWIIKDLEIPRKEVEDYITSTRCLAICADIANGTKHLGIDESRDPRSGEDLRMHPGIYITGDDPDHVELRLFILLEDGTQISALEIATDCVKKWDEFLNAHQQKGK